MNICLIILLCISALGIITSATYDNKREFIKHLISSMVSWLLLYGAGIFDNGIF